MKRKLLIFLLAVTLLGSTAFFTACSEGESSEKLIIPATYGGVVDSSMENLTDYQRRVKFNVVLKTDNTGTLEAILYDMKETVKIGENDDGSDITDFKELTKINYTITYAVAGKDLDSKITVTDSKANAELIVFGISSSGTTNGKPSLHYSGLKLENDQLLPLMKTEFGWSEHLPKDFPISGMSSIAIPRTSAT